MTIRIILFMKKTQLLLGMLFVLVLTGAGCIQFTGSAQGPMGVFVSQDSAESWQQKNVLLTAQGVKNLSAAKVYRIFTDPSDPKALYMGTRGQGLYYSYDNAETWNSSPALANKYIYALSVDPSSKCTIYVSDGPAIYKTSDCQRSWKAVFNEARPTQRIAALANDYTNSNIVYAAEAGGDIFKSQDGGTSWRKIKSFGFELRHLAVDPFNSKRLYVASYSQGLYRSDDSGDSWVTASSGFENFNGSLSFYRLIFNPSQENSLFWLSQYGILRSDNAGGSWTELKLLTPPGSVNIYTFGINPKNLSEMYYTGTVLGSENQNVRSTLYKTTDGGVNWVTKKLPTNTIPVELLINKENGRNIFLGFTTL
jgi:photosystem II stability/assembly factor-like uncharacterized protein